MSFLEESPQDIVVTEEVLSNEQFAQLTSEIELLRKDIISGKQIELADARKICVWFRARRRKNFTVVKTKAAKSPSTKAAPKRKTKVVLTPEEQKAALDNLLSSF
jgi:hypothetical protein